MSRLASRGIVERLTDSRWRLHPPGAQSNGQAAGRHGEFGDGFDGGIGERASWGGGAKVEPGIGYISGWSWPRQPTRRVSYRRLSQPVKASPVAMPTSRAVRSGLTPTAR